MPGRDIFVQSWYQGGISVVDITDPAHPVEIAFFDRGPSVADKLGDGGHWSSYWYNGHIYGSEILRGLDVLELVPTAQLSKNEIEAAKLVQVTELNVQAQQRIVWRPSFVVARAYLDQLGRRRGLAGGVIKRVSTDLAAAERLTGTAQLSALAKIATRLDGVSAKAADPRRVEALTRVVRGLEGKTS